MNRSRMKDMKWIINEWQTSWIKVEAEAGLGIGADED